ncbi:MAG: Zn-ribbon domain-containing OB-fold protein [Acidimicrobiales bacterium]
MTATTSGPEPAPQPFRVLPRLGGRDDHVWLGGEHGELRILRCTDDGTWIHPAAPRCPTCLGKHLEPQATAGKATVHAVTINHQAWFPGLDPPYVIAIVELPEQKGLRFTTSIIGIAPHEVTIGMAVRVAFERYDDVWLPFFEPDPDGARRAVR